VPVKAAQSDVINRRYLYKSTDDLVVLVFLLYILPQLIRKTYKFKETSMSQFGVFIKKIRAIEPHQNADALEFAVIDDFRSIVKKGRY